MIRVNDRLSIPEEEVEFDFVRSSGPGGQNVNKVNTAVQLRFDAARSPSLPEDVRSRLRRLAGQRMTSSGVLVIDARRHRSQLKNREEALHRLVLLLDQACRRPRTRRKTKPSKASVQRRLDSKTRRSRTKQMRKPVRFKGD